MCIIISIMAISEARKNINTLSLPADSSNESFAVLAMKDLLDPVFEEAYDRLTKLASELLKVPVALMSVTHKDRQFFKSYVGLGEPWATSREAPLSPSYCQHVTATCQVLKIENALEDKQLKDDPVTVQMGVVAYLGIPITTADSQTLGSFCVVHTKPHKWSEQDVTTLTVLTQAMITEVELRVALRQTELARQLAADSAARAIATLDQILDETPGSRRNN